MGILERASEVVATRRAAQRAELFELVRREHKGTAREKDAERLAELMMDLGVTVEQVRTWLGAMANADRQRGLMMTAQELEAARADEAKLADEWAARLPGGRLSIQLAAERDEYVAQLNQVRARMQQAAKAADELAKLRDAFPELID